MNGNCSGSKPYFTLFFSQRFQWIRSPERDWSVPLRVPSWAMMEAVATEADLARRVSRGANPPQGSVLRLGAAPGADL